jgi:hypothetical protein
MCGYLWFLYHNREVSYRAALNLTVSRRQDTLYEARGFDLRKWENLIEEANALRKEIKIVASEYDVEWDEKLDEGSEEVHKALKAERQKNKNGEKEDEDGDEDSDSQGKEKSKKDEEKYSETPLKIFDIPSKAFSDVSQPLRQSEINVASAWILRLAAVSYGSGI